MKKIGIDLGRHTIKIATLADSIDGDYSPEKHMTYPAVGDIKSKEYYQALKNYVSHFTETIDARRIEASVSISSAILDTTHTELMTLPTTDKKVLEKAIKFELNEQGMIDKLGNYHYLSEELTVHEADETLDDTGETDVLVSAIHKDILFGIAQLRKPSLSVTNIETQDRSYGRFLTDDDEIALVVDFGYKNIRLYFYRGNKIIEVSEFDGGGFYLAERVQQTLDTTTTSVAEALIKESSLSIGFTDEEDALADLLTDEITEYFNEVIRIVRSFEMEHLDEIDKIYYTGGITQINQFPQLIRTNFEYQTYDISKCLPIEETTNPDIDVHLEDSKPLDDTDTLDEEESSNTLSRSDSHDKKKNWLSVFSRKKKGSTSPMGAENDYPIELYSALYSSMLFDEEYYLEDMNFEKYLKFMIDYSAFLTAAISFSVVLGLGVAQVSKHHDNRINSLSNALNEETNQVMALNDSIAELNTKTTTSNEFINKVNSLTDVKGWYSETLFEVPEVTPRGIVVSEMTIKDSNIFIKGYALDYTQVGAFAMGLESLGDVSIDSVEDIEDSDIYATDIVSTDQVKPELRITKSYEITLQKYE